MMWWVTYIPSYIDQGHNPELFTRHQLEQTVADHQAVQRKVQAYKVSLSGCYSNSNCYTWQYGCFYYSAGVSCTADSAAGNYLSSWDWGLCCQFSTEVTKAVKHPSSIFLYPPLTIRSRIFSDDLLALCTVNTRILWTGLKSRSFKITLYTYFM